MIISGASTIPDSDGRRDHGELPSLDELRAALQPPDLPLPYPHDVLGAAYRVNDLLHAERYRDAHRLADAFRHRSARPSERLALLGAALRGSLRMGDVEQVERDAADIVDLLTEGGYSEVASVLVRVLMSSEVMKGRGAASRSPLQGGGPVEAFPAAGQTGARAVVPAPRGRRRGRPAEVCSDVLAVVRGLTLGYMGKVAAIRGEGDDASRIVAVLRSALAALPAVIDRLPFDPERELRLSLAQALELQGDREGATTQALDVLEQIVQEELETQEEAADPRRTATAAHTVLSRTLSPEHPLEAAAHALDALDDLHEVDDPPLRVGLITHLLQAFMAAGATSQASFTAGRLASLQRTLQRNSLRTGPLLAVAAQRVQAERYDAAWVPLDRARQIAHDQRDHRSSLEASRLAASIYERLGDHRRALDELRRLASEARWLADDLATAEPERAELVHTELNAHALVMRRALDLGGTAVVEEAAAAIERRTRPEGGRPLLPAELLWDHRVDARVARFIAIGEALNRREAGVQAANYERRRSEAMQIIDLVPAGHDARARYWAAYVDDRHAAMLAERGTRLVALRAARRAHAGWIHLGRAEDVARVAELIARLEGA